MKTTNEFRCFGPPGTGKTTWLARQIQRALTKYAPEEVFACSFTRAAAVELAGREIGLPRENVGTIHSLCYHAIGRPTILETDRELLAEWNQSVGSPDLHVHGTGKHTLDEPMMEDPDCENLQAWNQQRSILCEKAMPLRQFSLLWEAFKKRACVVDFTDLLLQAPRDIGAKILFVDEAQDLTPLQYRVVRQWAEGAEMLVLAGDDDQTIFDFTGASARELVAGLDSEAHVLKQSFRLPRAIYDYSERWIHQLPTSERVEKPYHPRDARGEVRSGFDCLYNSPAALVEHALEADGTAMILTTCNYMLQPILQALRGKAALYHNPYRKNRGDWNPLGRRSLLHRLCSFLKCVDSYRNHHVETTVSDWQTWLEITKGLFQHGKGAAFARLPETRTVDILAMNDEWLRPDVLEQAVNGRLEWFSGQVQANYAKNLDYATMLLKRHGPAVMQAEPTLTVGTIHSVKGGEADHVFLLPDLPWSCIKDPFDYSTKYATIRRFYVGMTRAKETLTLCAASGRNYQEW